MARKVPEVRKRPQLGRNSSMTVMIDPGVKLAAKVAARANGMSMALWVEGLIRSALEEAYEPAQARARREKEIVNV